MLILFMRKLNADMLERHFKVLM